MNNYSMSLTNSFGIFSGILDGQITFFGLIDDRCQNHGTSFHKHGTQLSAKEGLM